MALALSLPPSQERSIIVAMTYAVVIFSIIAQGLTVARITRHFVRQAEAAAEVEAVVQSRI